MKIVFMGTPEFAVPILEEIIKAGHEVGYVVTQPDRARNRNQITFSPVKETAVSYGISVLQPDKLSADIDVNEALKSYAPDAIVVVAYGQMLKKDILDLPKYGCFNVHGSLLPKLRGASPMQHAILDDHDETGVTIMKMAEGMDSGDIVSKSETAVDHKNFKELHDELSAMGAKLMSKTLPEIEAGSVTFVPQDDSKATYAGLIKKKDGHVDFSKTPRKIECQIRAFDPWPGAFCDYDDKVLKLWKGECLNDKSSTPDGSIISAGDSHIDIACGGGVLRITELQMPGKKRVSAADFLRGHKMETGEILK